MKFIIVWGAETIAVVVVCLVFIIYSRCSSSTDRMEYTVGELAGCLALGGCLFAANSSGAAS